MTVTNMTMTRQGLIHVLQALQHADDMMYHDIHEHCDGLYRAEDEALAGMLDAAIGKASQMLQRLYPTASDVVQAAIDDALAVAGEPPRTE